MRARYLGDHDSVTLWGVVCPKGVFVEVTGEMAQRKIAGNSHFEIEQSEVETVEFIDIPAGIMPTDEQSQVDALDVDGVGPPIQVEQEKPRRGRPPKR